MLFSDAIQEYLAYCKVERGHSRLTVLTYGSSLRGFDRWASADGPAVSVADLTPGLIRRYLYGLADQGLKPRSVRGRVNALRTCCDYLVSQGYLPNNPTVAMKTPKLDAPKQDIVDDAEARDILAACDRFGDARRSAVARGMMSVLIYGGLRRQELLDLKVGDVSLQDRCIHVRHGKGEKSRTVWPHTDCMAAIREWLRHRGTPQHDWLWSFNATNRYADDGLRVMLRDLKAIAGLADHDNIHPHAMRRGCATRLLRQGYSIKEVQLHLGHSHVETTSIYLADDRQRLRKISELGGLDGDHEREEVAPMTGPTDQPLPLHKAQTINEPDDSPQPLGSVPPLPQALAPLFIQWLTAAIQGAAVKGETRPKRPSRRTGRGATRTA